MHVLALATLAIVTAAEAPPAGRADASPLSLPAGLLQVEGKPLRVSAFERDGGVEVLLLRGRDLELLRLEKRTLVWKGAFRSPARASRPLLLDATPNPSGGDALVTVVFGDDVQSIDQGADTSLHGFVLLAGPEGGLRPASDDLRGYLRIAGGGIHLQTRGAYHPAEGRVHPVVEAAGRYAATPAEVPWAGRWLLETTPLLGGKEALAWEGTRPIVVKLEQGARAPDGSILEDLGSVEEPQIAVRLEDPIYKLGMDRQGKVLESWRPIPRRVIVASDGGAYTVLRGRSKPLLGRTSGQDAIVRLDWSGSEHLSLSRPYPGVEAFVIDFALVERPGLLPAALLLVNEKDDGSGRAHLMFQEPR
jgi:hypothetical protein